MPETRVSLIQRVRNRADAAAWAEFFSIYQPLLTAYVRKRGVHEHDAADVVQDVFGRLVPALAEFDFDSQRGRFRTWLWRVTHNALVDWCRRRGTRDRAEQRAARADEAPVDEPADDEWNQMYRRRILDVVLQRVRATSKGGFSRIARPRRSLPSWVCRPTPCMSTHRASWRESAKNAPNFRNRSVLHDSLLPLR